MLQPSAAQRFDPYKNYKFRLLDGDNVYFGSKATGLVSSAGIVEYRPGDNSYPSPRKLPGRNKYEGITLQRGVTTDQSFSNWASGVMSYGSSLGSEVPPKSYRKSIYLEFQNEAGQPVVSYRFSGNAIAEYPAQGRDGVVVHPFHGRDQDSIQKQLATIFENSLRKLRP